MSEIKSKLARIELLQQKIALRDGLPHLYGFPWYTWSRAYFESTNKNNFLCAANQISKSSTQIRKAIHWATAVPYWKTLWRTRPLQFWYLYPTMPVANIEFVKKWIPEFLPRGKFKDHPQYGWRAEWKHKDLVAVHFNTDVSIYFKTYGQDVSTLQTGTCHAIFTDEELPEEIYPELNMRRAATDGYYCGVFTATQGQEMWRRTIEPTSKKEELFPDAFKQQISMFDCQFYEDGTPSPWTPERIQQVIASCGTEAEVLRRVYGRFVVDENLKYPAFTRERNIKPAHPLPADWRIYAGIDLGSGESRHPAAICFVAVSPDFTKGRVFRGWRGDGSGSTTASDVLTKFQMMRGSLVMSGQYYDWQSRDFFTIATRVGEPFQPADKSHELGEQLLNVLFKNEMLCIHDHDELMPLVQELCSLRSSTAKTKARDDFIDALRYAVTRIPWNFSEIGSRAANILAAGQAMVEKPVNETDERRKWSQQQSVDEQAEIMIDQELESWQDLYDVD